MTLVKTFCCCCSLRSGALFAAIAGSILAIIGIILLFTVDVDIRTIILDDLLPKWAVKLILVINFAMTILISMLLLAGTLKRHMYLMLPWVLLALLLALGLLISVIYTAYNFFYEGDNTSGIIWIVVGLLAFVIYVYVWIVVYSFFQIIKEEHERRSQYSKAPFRRHY